MGDTAAKKKLPYDIQELEPAEKEEIGKLFSSNPPDYVRIGPGGYVVYRRYQTDAANIYNMPLRSTDIFVASYQRSGTTWTQELVWLLESNFNYTAAADVPLVQRYSFLEQFMFLDKAVNEEIVAQLEGEKKQAVKAILDSIAEPPSAALKSAPSPRFVKTHLPMCLLPPKLLDTAKVVYVARDPRDVAVSSYYHAKLFKLVNLTGEFKDFWNIFMKGLFTLTPYFEHVKEAWNKRNHPNMLFLFYEELSKDLAASVERVAKFLGKELTVEQKDRLCEHLKFDNFKNNKSVNYEDMREFGLLAENESFVRKGKAGCWRDHFDEEMTQQAEQWITENLRDTDLRFPHLN